MQYNHHASVVRINLMKFDNATFYSTCSQRTFCCLLTPSFTQLTVLIRVISPQRTLLKKCTQRLNCAFNIFKTYTVITYIQISLNTC